MAFRPSTWLLAVLFFAIPLAAFIWTSVPGLARYTLHLAGVAGLVAIGLSFVRQRDLTTLRAALLVTTIVLLVGATLWFLSPFFFLLYLTPLYLGFIFTPTVAFAFLAALLLIFSSSTGEVDIAYDIMVLLSLLLVIPLVIYLRRKYLVIRQTKRDILILEEGSGIKSIDTIARLLSNRITSLGVNVRQPLTFIRQAASMIMEDKVDGGEQSKLLKRIYNTASQALAMIKRFEGDTSANVVIDNVARQVEGEPAFTPAEKIVNKPHRGSYKGSKQK
jgi:signal transduction histidine kinase